MTIAPEVPSLSGEALRLRYHQQQVVHDVSVEMYAGQVTALIGPNGSGKSTVLRSLARLHKADHGRVSIDGSCAGPLSAKEFARRVTLLAQSRPHPTGLQVSDVVAFGRYPYRGRFSPLSGADRDAIAHALTVTGLDDLADRPVDQLSGGELQRVWLASCLAQDTGVLLLDEPTNHLDLRYQVEILDLICRLAADFDTALGVVLHDLNHAAAVADHVVLLHEGRVHAHGRPAEVLTAAHLSEVYGLPIDVLADAHGDVRIEARLGLRRRR